MVTAPSLTPTPMARTLPGAGPLSVLWLAALLFSVIVTHGMSPDGSAGHLATGGHTSASAHASGHASGPGSRDAGHGTDKRPTGPDGRNEDHGSAHPAADCAAAQPQQGADLSEPPATPWPQARTAHRTAAVSCPAWHAVADGSGPRAGKGSAVQQV